MYSCFIFQSHVCTYFCRYYVLVLAFITPFFAVANAYGTGLTDFDMSSVYGTVRHRSLDLLDTVPKRSVYTLHVVLVQGHTLFLVLRAGASFFRLRSSGSDTSARRKE